MRERCVKPPVEKALWFIESRLGAPVSLEDVAAAAGVSRHYLLRAFGEATGRSTMGYQRARRLSEAAKTLAAGAPDILAVALSAGYASHEAFTRAFRDAFGVTPEQLRAQGRLDGLRLLEPMTMTRAFFENLPEPRFVDAPPMLLVGMLKRYNCEAVGEIPAQWARFAPHLGTIPGEVTGAAYGVCHNHDSDGNFDYLSGVEVRDFTLAPKEFARLRLEPKRYAVFSIDAHISTIRDAIHTIWSRWLPESGLQPAQAPDFERYTAKFNPANGFGGYEIWIPVQA
jgi:AraC family transcriptional regulator